MRTSDLDTVHRFWFGPLGDFQAFNADRMALWFAGKADDEIARRFSETLAWVEFSSIDALALSRSQQVGLVVLLDQFPRNIFRGQPKSYAFDERARRVVDTITAGGMDKFYLVERAFLTICLGHSECLEDQIRAMRHFMNDIKPYAPSDNPLYRAGAVRTAQYLDIITKFGRFPHRNDILGRKTTVEEAEFLVQTQLASV